jgi:hypothetical protein
MSLSGSTSDLPKEPTPLLREATSANEDIEELGSGGQADPAIHQAWAQSRPKLAPLSICVIGQNHELKTGNRAYAEMDSVVKSPVDKAVMLTLCKGL